MSKFNKDWDFKTFMYQNYGFSYTREQERNANAEYLKLYLESKKKDSK